MKIKGITKIFKNYVKQYGSLWTIEGNPMNVPAENEIIISTVKKVHNEGSYPFSCWAVIGKDFEEDHGTL